MAPAWRLDWFKEVEHECGAVLTIPLFLVIGIGALVLVIMAAIKANEGVAYRYPLTLRLVK